MPIKPPDIPKTAVITPISLLEYVFMTFGLRIAAQTMQMYTDSIIRDIPCCYTYVDDLQITSIDQTLRRYARSIRPAPTSHHCSDPVFVSGDLFKSSKFFKDSSNPQVFGVSLCRPEQGVVENVQCV
ncbi:hypothetical protein AVEN_183978-1 [Araneus ventricosus]|uniref:Reverse transcriptase domain-containing protein n=1 Tax=Araneus ventricosus TaxID=182803 RepID=A0A4Y2E3D8_ARAVE|nr:hypothetical protein AVEN_183978-1 [Araneus ventricosus]